MRNSNILLITFLFLSLQATGMLPEETYPVPFTDFEDSFEDSRYFESDTSESSTDSEFSSEEYSIGWYDEKVVNMLGKSAFDEYFKEKKPSIQIGNHHIAYYDGKLSDTFEGITYFDHLFKTKSLYLENNIQNKDFEERVTHVISTAEDLLRSDDSPEIGYKIYLFLDHNREILDPGKLAGTKDLSKKLKFKYEEISKNFAREIKNLKSEFITERAKQVTEIHHKNSGKLVDMYINRYKDVISPEIYKLLLDHKKSRSYGDHQKSS